MAIIFCLLVLSSMAANTIVTNEFHGRENVPPSNIVEAATSDCALTFELPTSSADYPTFVTSGALITQGKHFIPNPSNVYMAYSHASIGLWLFYVEGTLGTFFKMNFQSTSAGPGCFEMKGVMSGSGQLIQIVYNGGTENVGMLNLGWNWIGFGTNLNNYLFWNICLYSLDCIYNATTTPAFAGTKNYPAGVYAPSCPASATYLGCYDCSDSNVKYIIHSLKAHTGNCMYRSNTFPAYAPTNTFLAGCGNLIKSGKQCDDGNMFDGDGCDSNCDLELGWNCVFNGDGVPDICQKCGSSKVEGTEQCDDGNASDNDGCSSACIVESGYTCDTSSPTICSLICSNGILDSEEECDDGNLDSGDGCSDQCILEDQDEPNTLGAVSLTPQAASSISLGVVGSGVGFSIAASFIKGASPQSAVSLINMMQMLLLLPIVGAYLPSGIIEYLANLSNCMFSFPFLKITRLPCFSGFANSLEAEQRDSYLASIGLESGSTFINLLNLVGVIFLMPILYIIFYLCNLCVKKCSKCECLSKFIEKLLKGMKIGAYIRLFYELYLLIFLSIMDELYTFSIETVYLKISLCLTFVSLAVCIFLFGLSIQQWFKSKSPEKFAKQKYFIELFSGIKNSFICRSYCVMFLSRRTISIFVIIVLQELSMTTKVYTYLSIQIINIICLILIRPFKLFKDNLIELANEVTYCFLCSFLCYYNTAGRWNDKAISVFIYTIFASMAVSATISLLYVAIHIFISCYRRCNGTKVEQYRHQGSMQGLQYASYYAQRRQEEEKHSGHNASISQASGNRINVGESYLNLFQPTSITNTPAMQNFNPDQSVFVTNNFYPDIQTQNQEDPGFHRDTAPKTSIKVFSR